MLNNFIALELIFKNSFFRKVDYKPISLITDVLFYQEDISLERFLFLNYDNTKVINTDTKVDISSEFSFNGFDFKLQLFTKKDLNKTIKNSSLVSLFLEKKLTISKNGVTLYIDGKIKNGYNKEKANIQNSIFFFGEKLKEKVTKEERFSIYNV